MKQRRIGIALLLFIPGLFFGCGEKIEPGTTAPVPGPELKAVVAEARISGQPLIYEAVGTVQPRTASTLSSKVMGSVLAVHVKEGDRVKVGDVLVDVDARQVTAQLRQAEASLAEARKAETAAQAAREAALANAAQAGSAYERARKLLEGEAVTRESFEGAEARHKAAQAAVTQAEAMVEAAQYRIKQARAAAEAVAVTQKDTLILAPYDGKVTAKMVEVGDLAAPGTPFLSLERVGGYQVDLILPEFYIKSVRVGQNVQLAIPAVSGQPMKGIVETIVPRADEKSRTFLLKVGLPENAFLRPGLFARVAVPVGREQILLVPSSAVVPQGQLTGIYLINEENIARFRLIRTGRIFGDHLEIVTGLEAGARFIVSPTPQMVDGAHIEAVS